MEQDAVCGDHRQGEGRQGEAVLHPLWLCAGSTSGMPRTALVARGREGVRREAADASDDRADAAMPQGLVVGGVRVPDAMEGGGYDPLHQAEL